MRRSLVVALVASVVAATVAVAAPAMAAVPTYQVARQITLPSTGAAGVAVDSARGLLYVASRDANAVWVYDEATLTLQATIAVPNQPYNLAVGPTGYVYVSQYTGNGLAGSVAAIDPTTRTVVDTNATGNSPFGVTVSQDGTRLWVGNDSSGFISVFDLTNPASPLPIAAIPLASTSERVTEGPNGLLYVTTNNSQVFVVNRATGATTTTWTGLASAHQVMISADGTHAFVSQDSGATAPIFDLATNAASGSIPVGATFYQSTDPSLGAGFITASSADALAVIDSTTGALLQTVPGVTGAYYTATDPATHRTFVTSLNGTTLTEVTPTAPVVTTNPTDQIVTAGDAATFTAAATSTPPLAVQWQQSTDNGASWADIPGATSDSYTTPPTGLSDSGHQFRAVFTNNFGSTTTTAATLTVNPPPPPVVTTNPVDQTVVEGAAATFTAAATSSVAETVQWQVSTDGGGSFSDVAGATSDTLTVPSTTLGQSGNQYRAVFTNPGGTATTTAATLTVTPAVPVVTTNPTDQTVAEGATATFTAAATSSVAETVQWQVSTDGGATFSEVAGATSDTLTVPSTTTGQSGNQYRAVFTNPGGTATTTAATLTVTALAPVVTTNPADQTVVEGATATFTAAATSSVPETVQWQVSTDGGGSFSDVAGATSDTLTVASTTVGQSGNQYRAVFTNAGGIATTTAATLTVIPLAPVVTTNPTDQTVVEGAAATFTAAATSSVPETVQWQVSTDGGGSFTDVAGATSDTLTVPSTTTGQSGNQYRAVFTNPGGTATTTAAVLTVTPLAPVVTTNPADQTVTEGATATFTAAATSSVPATVQWQMSTDSGGSFSDVAGATSDTFTVPSTTVGQSGNQYRAVFTNPGGTATTTAATLTVTPLAPVVTTNPTDQTVVEGATATFTAAATSSVPMTVQWQVSTDGGGSFTDVAGATSDTLSVASTTLGQSGDQYRAVFTNPGGASTSTAATLTVTAAPPVVTTNPTDQTVVEGAAATFTAAATSSVAETVQWQVSTDGGGTFSDVPGATSDTLSVPSTTLGQSGNQYRAVFTNPGGTATTTAAALTVTPAVPVVTTNPADQTVVEGATATFTAAATSSVPATVQWQVSTDGGATFSDVAGATSDTLTVPSTTTGQSGNQYRAVFTNPGGTATTTAATLTVTPLAPVVTTNPADQTVVEGATATFTAAATSSVPETVQWQVSTDGGATFSDVAGATSDTLTVASTTVGQSGDQYRAVFTNPGGTATTTAAVLTVTPLAPVVTTNPADLTVAEGAAATFTAAATSSVPETVQWQVSTDGGATFSDAPGATSDTLTVPATTLGESGNQYRAVFTNPGGTVTTTAATLTVTPDAPVVTTNPTDQAVVEGATATFTAAATSSVPETVQWQVSTDGGTTWGDLPGATTATLTIAPTVAAESGNQYRAVFTNPGGSATSTAATLTVTPLPPVVTTNPADQTVTEGATATFTAAATSSVPTTVQWQVSTDGGATWTDVAGGTLSPLAGPTAFAPLADPTSTLSVPLAALTQSGNQYRAVFTNAGGSATTTAATLTVTPQQAPPPAAGGETSNPGGLAGTGSNVPGDGITAVAFLLFFAGIILLVAGRRRKRAN